MFPLVQAHLVSPGQRAIKRLCVCIVYLLSRNWSQFGQRIPMKRTESLRSVLSIACCISLVDHCWNVDSRQAETLTCAVSDSGSSFEKQTLV